MAVKKVGTDEIKLAFGIKKGTEEVKPLAIFPSQPRVESAFNLALKTEKEGYNVYVSGPESIGRTTYTLRKLKEKAKEKPAPEDICYYHDFEEPLKPKYLLLPKGLGKELKKDIDEVIESLKEQAHKMFESKEYEEEREKIVKELEKERERLLEEMTREAQKYNLAVVFTPAGVALLPVIQGRVIPEVEVMRNPVLKEAYERSLEAFEDKFREYMRRMRELDYKFYEELKKLKNKTASYIVENLLFRLEEKYKNLEKVPEFLRKLKKNLIENIHFFIEWKLIEENVPLRRLLEMNINLFRINVIVDNSKLEHAPVVYEELPSFRSLFGYISYKGEMGILYADHNSIVAGSLHRARGGFLVLRVQDILRNPFLWISLKRVLLHKKIYIGGPTLSEISPFFVGIDPEPVPFEGKIFLIGDSLTFQLLSILDPEFNRLFKVKAEFDPVVKLSKEIIEEYPGILKKIVSDEKLKDLTPDGVEEVLKYAVRLSGSRKKLSVVFGYITDILREADAISEGERITGSDVKKAIKEKIFRSNLIEEKIRELIAEGKIIIEIEGRRQGQVNGLSVYELGDISFGKPTRITATAYIGEKGIIDIEREVELSGPIHSKGVLILTGYLGNKYGRSVPLSLSCSITFEQLYDEVEGDSASVAELMAVLSAISEVPLRQDVAITGSLDQYGHVQPVGGIKEKVEGFWKVCKVKGLTGKQGVIIPSRNYDNLVLDDELIEDIEKGLFNIYTVDTVDDVIEIMTGLKAYEFHRKVLEKLKSFTKVRRKRKK